MKLKYSILSTAIILALSPLSAAAQANGTNSSYSRFGLGLPCDQSQSYNRSMGGVAQGLRNGSRVNMQNPASYSAMDSLTFIFDVGMSLQRTRFAQNGGHTAANNTSFDHVNASFRLARNLGMSVGFQPFTKIGYNFSMTQDVTIDPYTGQDITNGFVFNGSGGVRHAYIGAGWQPFKGFSFGANIGFLWGDINNQITQTFAENGTANNTGFSSLRTTYTSNIKSWKGDAAVQFVVPFKNEDRLTIGATVGIGHPIGGETSIIRTALSGDTIKASTDKAFSLPMSYSAGAAWEHKDKLTLAADFTLEQWSKCNTPQFDATTQTYYAATGAYTDRWRINAGAEYVPSRFDHQLAQRINYRVGAYYSSPYINIPKGGATLNGPCEFGITAGVGIPITNGWVNKTYQNIYSPSYVNIGIEWAQRAPGSSALIRENIMLVNIGLTFNERWFMKWLFR